VFVRDCFSPFFQSALKYALAAITAPETAGINPTVTLFESKLTKK
jgi:hypothetical protein